MPLMRVQKFLSFAGFCSRRKGEEYIKKGLVKVNGKTAEIGASVDPEKDRIEVNGKLVKLNEKDIYIALNKPVGYVASCFQPGAKIVLDLINIPQRVYPVGRLDKDSTGLLILTNDGKLHNICLHPSFDHEKEYEVRVAKPITSGALKSMEKGLPMMGTKTRPAKIKRISAKSFNIILKEGKNRQIRRMVRKVGNRVASLKRIRFSGVKLGRLEEGSWRYLTKNEIDFMKGQQKIRIQKR